MKVAPGQPDILSTTRRFLFAVGAMPVFCCTAASWLAAQTQEFMVAAAILGWFVGTFFGIIGGVMLRRHSWLQVSVAMLAAPVAVPVAFKFTGSARSAVAAGFLTAFFVIFVVWCLPESLPRHAARGVCPWCGHDLSGLPSPRCCPECGRHKPSEK